jgi:hypothetical protein
MPSIEKRRRNETIHPWARQNSYEMKNNEDEDDQQQEQEQGQERVFELSQDQLQQQQQQEETFEVLEAFIQRTRLPRTGIEIEEETKTSSLSSSLLALAEEFNWEAFASRLKSLSIYEARREGEERNELGACALHFLSAHGWPSCANDSTSIELALCKHLVQVSLHSINFRDLHGESPALLAAEEGNADILNFFCLSGADLSLKDLTFNSNCFGWATQTNALNRGIIDVLATHSIMSNNIPSGFQSPMYFTSKHYKFVLREQRWLNRSVLMLSVNRVYQWSIINQIEVERYRTLPDDLSVLGKFIARCWFDVAGSDKNKADESDSPDNGVGRLIMSFAFGFDDSKGALIGMPEYGKLPASSGLVNR